LLEPGIDQDEPPLLHRGTSGDERVMHRHLDQPLIAADRTAAEEIGRHVTAAETEAPDRMIAAHSRASTFTIAAPVVAAGPESDRVGAIVDEDAVDIGVVGQRIFDRPTGLCVDASDRVVDRISCSKRITDPPSAVGRADDFDRA
jgi:hypothetical protein